MKSRFSNIDLVAAIAELRSKLIGMRVANIYDIDNKTYLIRLQKPDCKAILLLESGNRINATDFDWPKNMSPSGFSMKLRKHLRSRRLESIEQVGADRIIDMTFGSNEAAYHVILELYDRGNIVLTDFEYTILNILRPRTDNDDQSVKFIVREKYPLELAKPKAEVMVMDEVESFIKTHTGSNLKKILTQHFEYGPAVMEHCLLEYDMNKNATITEDFICPDNISKLHSAILKAEEIVLQAKSGLSKGFIIQKRENRSKTHDALLTYNEYHPFLFKQHETQSFLEFESFNKAIDEFYSKLESQKLEMKVLQQEKAALKKLENVKSDHQKRIKELQQEQDIDHQKGYFIELNLTLVDQAIKVIQSAIANQIDWDEIQNIVSEAQSEGDPVAKCIKKLKLESNHMSLQLSDPFDEGTENRLILTIDIDLNLTAHANSRKYYSDKKQAVLKESKTVSASSVALKSAERKTKEALKEVNISANIIKIRKTYWFEKFLWFISSENYLVIGGRDQQQNELIVKRYLKSGDVYVHADLHGACSIIIKNNQSSEIPPKTLNEAGSMAICYSAAWDAKIVTSAWWVYHHQVSKTAPTGEFLSTGSFMIRGKKNYLPPCNLVYGFGFLLKLDDESVAQHKGERHVRTLDFDVLHDSPPINPSDNIPISDDQADGLDKVVEELDLNDSNSDSEIDDIDHDNKSVDIQYPDTSLDLKGIKAEEEIDSEYVIFFGDGKPIILGDKVAKTGSKLSAKQKRDLKKQKKSGMETKDENIDLVVEENDICDEENSDNTQNDEEENDEVPCAESSVKQIPLKRGQRAKMKKIKEKYGDQDDEERAACMQILASSGSTNTDKKSKKNKKKSKEKYTSNAAPVKVNVRPDGLPARQLNINDIKIEPVVSEKDNSNQNDNSNLNTDKTPLDDDKILPQADANSDNEQDDTSNEVDFSILDTFTGIPSEDDILLYAVPVCAPYSTLTNYKFKIKLAPGSTKRGKAAKTALNMFISDKKITNREKELLKVIKDTDLSRNMPGKVKLSAPNLHRNKKK